MRGILLRCVAGRNQPRPASDVYRCSVTRRNAGVQILSSSGRASKAAIGAGQRAEPHAERSSIKAWNRRPMAGQGASGVSQMR